MEIKNNIFPKELIPFFEEPGRSFYIRGIARELGINHTTVGQKLNKFVKEGFLKKEKTKERIYPGYSLNETQRTLNLKFYYNLEKIYFSGLLEDLGKYYDYPVIVLFGSYFQARDDEKSDLDLFILSEVNKEIDVKKYEKKVNRKISLHLFNQKTFDNLVKKKSDFINSVINGFVLSGQLEVLK
jgi:predicted nucleotidyltransferase